MGGVAVGGGAPVTVQSMTTTKTADVEGTLAQIYALAAAGADIVRCTCNEEAAAEGLAQIVPRSPVPIIADIHFHHEMALAALEAGVQGLRLNPGQPAQGRRDQAGGSEAKDRGVPIRIGVNAGSLHPDLYKRFGGATPEALVESARMELAYFAEVGFDDVKISVKASSVPLMIESYRLASETFDHPLHLGVTEAGPPPAGLVKGTAGIATLLAEGIGDTIRYSLTADPVEEARAGRQLLEALGLRERKGLDLIACPSCGRAEIDVIAVARAAQEALEDRNLPIQVAVMGCVVNGPGEAREADLGHRRRTPAGPSVHQGQDRPGRARGRDGRRPWWTRPSSWWPRGSRPGWPRPMPEPRPRPRPTGGRCSRPRATTPTPRRPEGRADPQEVRRRARPRPDRRAPRPAVRRPVGSPTMRMSRLLVRTLREAPADAEVASHQLLVRAGYIRRLASGVYTFLPLGLRVLARVERVIREELDAAGCQEVLLPALHPIELWEQSGRAALFGSDALPAMTVDARGGTFVLGPTHEEVVTVTVGAEVDSYRQLPLTVYQIQVKFRDEARPRFGLLRTRELIMADAYSFDVDKEAMQASYRTVFDAYLRIFGRLGLGGDPGGGSSPGPSAVT